MQGIAKSALMTVDADFRSELMQTVVVAGGTINIGRLSSWLPGRRYNMAKKYRYTRPLACSFAYSTPFAYHPHSVYHGIVGGQHRPR